MPIVAALLWVLAGCGGEAPEPTPTATPVPAVATPTPAGEVGAAASTEAVIDTPPATNVVVATPGVPATPTISELTVVENDGNCSIDYDLDLAGFPDLVQKMGCALEESRHEPVGINEFGAGPEYNRFMLWFSEEMQIYVLFPDQTWQAYRDTWDESQPEFLCNPLNVPPSSPPLPRRGFGKLWCQVEGLGEKMGTIEREERLCQHVIVQPFERGRMVACFEDATIRYFSLLNDGTWDLLMVQ
ncbi:MAG: hypothetical protein H3C34_01250 [Caldilineaceae bacterium]|nr:hypothetical protein [Caldilineaceae bacterium]